MQLILQKDGMWRDGVAGKVMCMYVSVSQIHVTKALVWIVLGSLIRPADLIPYAIMVAAAVASAGVAPLNPCASVLSVSTVRWSPCGTVCSQNSKT